MIYIAHQNNLCILAALTSSCTILDKTEATKNVTDEVVFYVLQLNITYAFRLDVFEKCFDYERDILMHYL